MSESLEGDVLVAGEILMKHSRKPESEKAALQLCKGQAMHFMSVEMGSKFS